MNLCCWIDKSGLCSFTRCLVRRSISVTAECILSGSEWPSKHIYAVSPRWMTPLTHQFQQDPLTMWGHFSCCLVSGEYKDQACIDLNFCFSPWEISVTMDRWQPAISLCLAGSSPSAYGVVPLTVVCFVWWPITGSPYAQPQNEVTTYVHNFYTEQYL